MLHLMNIEHTSQPLNACINDKKVCLFAWKMEIFIEQKTMPRGLLFACMRLMFCEAKTHFPRCRQHVITTRNVL